MPIEKTIKIGGANAQSSGAILTRDARTGEPESQSVDRAGNGDGAARDHNTLILQIQIPDRTFSGKMTQWNFLRQDSAVHHNRLRLGCRIGRD